MRVLIVSLGDWQGPSRIPKALKAVGWEVATLCRKSYAAAKTRYVDQFFFVNPQGEMEVMRDIIQAVEAWKPTLIVPAMETAVSALLEIWRLYEHGKLPGLSTEAVEAIRRSIPDPAAQRYFYSKIDLLNTLAERGVRIPAQRELHTFGDADVFVQEHGYPVIIKPDYGYAGSGISICHDEEALLAALTKRLNPTSGQRWCIQRYIPTKSSMYQLAAKDGVLLAGYSLYRVETYPGVTGPSSVIRMVENPEMEHAARELAKLLGYNGFGSAQFMTEDEGLGKAYLIEGNLRLGVSMHLSSQFGPDLNKALFEAYSGQPVAPYPSNLGLTIALYPAEVFRDRNSEYMKGIVDYVEDDPELEAHFAQQIEEKLAALAGN